MSKKEKSDKTILSIKKNGLQKKMATTQTEELIIAINELKKAQEKLLHANRLYAFISQINQTIVHVKEEQELFNAVCKIAVNTGKFELAWIGKADEPNGKINLVAEEGAISTDLEVFSSAAYKKNGPIANVLQSGTLHVINNIAKSELDDRWKQYAIVRGFQANIYLPLKKSGKTTAIFNLFSAKADFFDQEEAALLQQAADDISFALDFFEKEKLKVNAEEALRESELNLQAIFENTSEGFILIDTKGEIKNFNKRARDIEFLNTGEEIETGKNILNLYDLKKHDYKDMVLRVLSGETINFDHSYTRKKGEVKWFSWTKTPVYNKGIVEGICITSADITDRKMGEEKILHANRLYAFISEINKTIVHVKDEQTLFNEACRIAIKQGEFRMARIGIPDPANRRIRLTASSGETGLDIKKFTEYTYELNGLIDKTLKGQGYFVVNEIQKDHDMVWKEYAAKRGFNAVICLGIKKLGKVVGVFIIYSSEINFFNAEEITLLKEVRDDLSFALDVFEKEKLKVQAEEALHESESNLQAIFENTSEGFILTDTEGIIKSFNNKAKDIFLLNSGKKIITGKAIFDFVDESRREAYRNAAPEVLAGKELYFDLSFEGKKGETKKWFIFTINRVNTQGKVEGFSITVRDITKRKEAEYQLQESESFNKGILASLNSHIAVIDKRGIIIAVNKAWNDFAIENGVTALERTSEGSNYFQVCKKAIGSGDAIAGEALEGILSVFEKVETFELEYPCHSPKQQRWFILHVMKFGNDTSKVVISHQDITERKLSEEKLNQSEKYSRNLFEQTEIGLALARMDGTLVDVNEAYAKIIGRTIEETLKLTYWEVTPEKYHDQEDKVLEGLKDTGKFINYEKEYIHKNGNLVPVRLSGNIFEKNGEKFIWSSVEDITELKKADEQNRAQANLLNMIGQAAIATDLDGVVNYWNKAAENIYGWTSEETIGKNIIHLTPSQATREQALEIMEDLKNGRTWSGEFSVQRKDGTDFPALITDSPIYDQNNKLSGIIGISSDITESKKAEERLIQSEAKLKKAQSIAHVGSWQVNLDNHKHSWSDEFCRIFGIECDEVIPSAEAFLSFIHPHDAALAISSMENAFATFTDSSFSFQFIKKNGELGQGTSEWKFEFDQYDKPIRLDGILRDITEQTKLENATLKAYEEKNAILESIGDAFFAVDKDWTVTYWNKEAEKMLLTPRVKIIGINLWQVFSNSIDSESYKKYHEAIETNQVIDFEDYYAVLDKWFEISAYPSATGLSVFFKDVSERKNSEVEFKRLNALLEVHSKELATSNKKLEQFAYVASHDLQEPLRMVTSFLTQIEKKYGNIIDEKGRQYIHFAVDGAKRMRQIILDLLEFSRVGHTEDKQEEVDLNELLDEILSLLRKKIEDKKAVITIGKLPLLKAFRSPLHQVFQNLVNNSLTYHKKDGNPEISIYVKDKENYWEFAVTDNGIGIDPDYFNKIFTIFQRLHNKDEYSGTGIGLAITKKIIESMGGKIWVESEEGKGSTFYFTLPKNA
ncbi:MAG: PAS domain S-box protein [Ferruginibacter sp.]